MVGTGTGNSSAASYVLYVFLVRENDEIYLVYVMEGKRDFLKREEDIHVCSVVYYGWLSCFFLI